MELTAIGLLVVGWLIGVYFAPVLAAIARGHNDTGAIVVVNLFLGWTLFGWVIALAWAFTNNTDTRRN